MESSDAPCPGCRDLQSIRPRAGATARARAAAGAGRLLGAELRRRPSRQASAAEGRAIRLVHLPQRWPEAGPGAFYVALYLNLRQRVRPEQSFDYQLGGFCKASGQGLRCVPEWEAGSWRIERGPDGTLDLRNAGIVANPNPYDAEEIADGAVRIPARPDDGLWRLSPASGPCGME